MVMVSYDDLIASYAENPRDVLTTPKNKRIPLWFYVFVKDGVLRVKTGQLHSESISRIKGSRRLSPKKFGIMLDLYRRRCAGEAVSNEAHNKTWNQVYWYGIFANMDA